MFDGHVLGLEAGGTGVRGLGNVLAQIASLGDHSPPSRRLRGLDTKGLYGGYNIDEPDRLTALGDPHVGPTIAEHLSERHSRVLQLQR